MLWATAFQTGDDVARAQRVLLPEKGMLRVKSGYPPEDMLDDADLARAAG